MKILAISDIHGNIGRLDELLKVIEKNKIETVLFTGDIVKGKARGDEWLSALKEGRKPVKTEAILDETDEVFVQFFRWFDSNHLHLATIPGNMDAPLKRYYKVINYKLSFSNYLHQIHEGFWPHDKGFVFSGFGGSIGDVREEYFVFQSMPDDLNALMVEKDQGKMVFLFHHPPTGGVGITGDVDRGHQAINNIITKHEPWMVFVGHSHSQGTQKIGNTVVLNPGSLKKGQAAIVDLETRKYDFITL
ncbi:MAG: metallophosphoesterase family protein [Candidatus Hodarchaeales archaeon]